MLAVNEGFFFLPIEAIADNTMGRGDWIERELPEIIRRLRSAESRSHLLQVLYAEVSRYSLSDLQRLRGVVEHEYRGLWPAYRKKLYPKTMEQIFGAHHCLICLYRRGREEIPGEELPDTYSDFCGMVEKSVTATDVQNPRLTLLYYLLSAFTIFVQKQPGHPVGTPFPGGETVWERNGEYFCPVREKENDVESSICPYCVAKPTR
ncbi:MAG: DUF2115 domain-containing protein [Methanomicrobiaceae archaeon]|nr:DUF2115 domain-containing protein [Methanomicrobiaceae archaeon]